MMRHKSKGAFSAIPGARLNVWVTEERPRAQSGNSRVGGAS